MNRIDRLFAMLTLLQSKKYVPAEKLADKFGLSIRTVYRDVKALCESGIPVSFEPQRGYFLVQGYFLPPVSFTTDEANAFLLMEKMVQGFADQSIHQHYSTAMNKVKSVLRSSEKDRIEHLNNNIHLQVPPCYKPDFEYLSVLQSGISTRAIIELDYKNNNNEVSKRQVEPIGLVFYAFGWHLIAWCAMRQDYRDFKVARILKLKNTGIPFSKTGHIELNDYMKQLPVNY